jgi:AraC family transcriptional regulator
MSSLHETERLYRTRGLEIRIEQCRRPVDHGDAEEATSADALVFPLSGVFVKAVRGHRVTADLNHVLYFSRNEPYRVSHPVPDGDRCLVLTLGERELVEAMALRDARVQDRADHPFQATHALRSPRAALLIGQLLMTLRRASAEPLAVEETALDLVDAALPFGPGLGAEAKRSRATANQHAEIAAAVQALLAARFREVLRLDDLGAAMGCSRFHLLRLFRRSVGVPIHRYQVGLRLGAAVERLANGESDISRLALELGFADHGHFTHAFGQKFGVTPSEFRRSRPGGDRFAASCRRPGA